MSIDNTTNAKRTLSQKFKKSLWVGLYPFYRIPFIQRHVLRLHQVWYKGGRQQYHIGFLAQGVTLETVKTHLRDIWNFGENYVAWIDKGQVLSWRRLDGFDFQYHIRIFDDGEIRGHYEYTPESRPFAHLLRLMKKTGKKSSKTSYSNTLSTNK